MFRLFYIFPFLFFCPQLLVGDIQVIANDDDTVDSPPAKAHGDTTSRLTIETRDNNHLSVGYETNRLSAASSEDTVCATELDSLTFSEDSDATRIYDLNSRETKILRYAIIKESRNATPTPPTSPTGSDYQCRSPSFAVDRAIQQLTSNSKRKRSKSQRQTVGKLKPNLFSESEARLKEHGAATAAVIPKKLLSNRSLIEIGKMADVEVAVVVSQPIVETQTHTQQSNHLETNVSVITNGNCVTNIESATETSKAEHVVNETSTNATDDGIVAVKEGVTKSTAELVQHKELSTTEDGERTVLQETTATESVERNQSEIFTQAAWHPAALTNLTNGESTVINGEAASQVSSTEEVHRSESTVVTTEEDPESNVTRTITVTTSLVGVKHRILSESSEVIMSTGENLSIADVASLKLAMENGTLDALLTGQTNGDQPSPQIVSEMLKTPIIESPAGQSPVAAIQFKYPPSQPVEVIIVSAFRMFSKCIWMLIMFPGITGER